MGISVYQRPCRQWRRQIRSRCPSPAYPARPLSPLALLSSRICFVSDAHFDLRPVSYGLLSFETFLCQYILDLWYFRDQPRDAASRRALICDRWDQRPCLLAYCSLFVLIERAGQGCCSAEFSSRVWSRDCLPHKNPTLSLLQTTTTAFNLE